MPTISSGFLRWALRRFWVTDGGRVEHLHLVGLLALAAREDAELDPGAGLERGDALGQRRGADVDVVAVLAGEEAEALLGVVPLDLSGGHRTGLSAQSIAAAIAQREHSVRGRDEAHANEFSGSCSGSGEQLVHRPRAEPSGSTSTSSKPGLADDLLVLLGRRDQRRGRPRSARVAEVADAQVADPVAGARRAPARRAASARSTRASRAGVISMP